MRYRALILVFVCACLVVGQAWADEVVFNNGDKLTGKILILDGGKLVMKTAVAGEVKVDLKDVKTFSTDEPIEIHLADGTVLRQRIIAGEAGKFTTAAGGAVAPQPFNVSSIAKVNPPKEAWTGDVSAGLLISRGNSETDNANLSINLARRGERDRMTLNGAYLYGRQEDPDTGNKSTVTDSWFAAGKYDYFFTPKFYGYGAARVGKDRIADVDLRLMAGGGVGYQWIEKPDLNFSTEAGLSWFYEDFSGPTETNDSIAVRLAYHFDKSFNDKVKFFHNLEYYPSLEDLGDYFINTDVGVRATLTARMFTEFKTILMYDSTPAEDTEELDVRYMLGVGWAF